MLSFKEVDLDNQKGNAKNDHQVGNVYSNLCTRDLPQHQKTHHYYA